MKLKWVFWVFSLLALTFSSCDIGDLAGGGENTGPTAASPGSGARNAVTTSSMTDALLMELMGNTARVEGTITVARGSNMTRSGVCWNTLGDPRMIDNYADAVNITGNGYFATITGLAPNTLYYARMYAEIDREFVYGNTITFNSGRLINSMWAGGLVFYNNGSGGGLVMSDALSSGYAWSNITDALATATAPDFGAGYGNTLKISGQAGHTSSAAKLCADYANGYADWYLPSSGELELAMRRLNLPGTYWSSTEDSPVAARTNSLIYGPRQGMKTALEEVRAIRNF
jgi:hypothetical protein